MQPSSLPLILVNPVLTAAAAAAVAGSGRTSGALLSAVLRLCLSRCAEQRQSLTKLMLVMEKPSQDPRLSHHVAYENFGDDRTGIPSCGLHGMLATSQPASRSVLSSVCVWSAGLQGDTPACVGAEL